jgi:large subunit ribosomal protein L21
MYAIVDIGGQQFRAEKGIILKVPFIQKAVGEKVDFDRILLFDDEKKIKVGQPLVKGTKVSAKILAHGRDKKVIIFKKKRRKGYKVKKGHRQNFTKIQIDTIA